MLNNLKNVQLERLAPLLLLATLFFIPMSTSLRSIFIVLSTLILLITPSYKNRLPLALAQPWSKAAILLFIVVSLASVWSAVDVLTRVLFVQKYSKLLLLPILVTGFTDKKTRNLGVQLFLIAMLFTCLVSIIKDFIQEGSSDGLFHNHISTGFMMAFSAYLSGFFAIKQTGGKRIFYCLLLLLFSYQVLFVNIGRMGYLLYFVLMILLLIQHLTIKQIVICVLIFTTLFAICSYQNQTFLKRVDELQVDFKGYQQGIKNRSISGRLLFHNYAKSLFISSPWIGHGTGSFGLYFQKDNTVEEFKLVKEPHSQYWLIASEAGVLGLAALFYFFLSLLLSALRLCEHKTIMLGMLACFIVSNTSDSQLLHSDVGYLFIIFTALCLGEAMATQHFDKAIAHNKTNAPTKTVLNGTP